MSLFPSSDVMSSGEHVLRDYLLNLNSGNYKKKYFPCTEASEHCNG